MGRHTTESTRNLGPAASTSWFTSQRTKHSNLIDYDVPRYAKISENAIQVDPLSLGALRAWICWRFWGLGMTRKSHKASMLQRDLFESSDGDGPLPALRERAVTFTCRESRLGNRV